MGSRNVSQGRSIYSLRAVVATIFAVRQRIGAWGKMGRRQVDRDTKGVGDTGLEPVTSTMSTWRSNQLS